MENSTSKHGVLRAMARSDHYDPAPYVPSFISRILFLYAAAGGGL